MKLKTALLFGSLLAAFPAISQSYEKLASRADSLYKAKNYPLSVKTYEAAFKTGKPGGTDCYNAACSAALAGNSKMAFRYLNHAVENNWLNVNHTKTDSDLASLHDQKAWPKVVAKMQQKLDVLEADYDKPLQAELFKIYDLDQGIREEFSKAADELGYKHPKVDSLGNVMARQDSLNQLSVKAILEQYGWVGPKKVGPEASQTLFLVIQHASQQYQERYLPLVREASKKGEIPKSSLALLEDRIAMRQGKKQLYGSQIGMDQETGAYYVMPLEDPKNVDRRRAHMGLGPIAEYVKTWNITWNAEEFAREQAEN
jgi:hypothetical protein